MASPIIINPVPPAVTDGDKGVGKPPEATHGGFRDNIHFNAYEALSPSEEGMGRDLLRRSEPLSDEELLTTDKYDDIKSATPVRGSKSDYKTSPWASAKGD